MFLHQAGHVQLLHRGVDEQRLGSGALEEEHGGQAADAVLLGPEGHVLAGHDTHPPHLDAEALVCGGPPQRQGGGADPGGGEREHRHLLRGSFAEEGPDVGRRDLWDPVQAEQPVCHKAVELGLVPPSDAAGEPDGTADIVALGREAEDDGDGARVAKGDELAGDEAVLNELQPPHLDPSPQRLGSVLPQWGEADAVRVEVVIDLD
mmetsp:Transcript_18786/g.52337  ORF Transcript_18786/g.52337 Transcript_18786/m.52337 type:complete len:206 (-) Transcript_18786:664-1281(-)